MKHREIKAMYFSATGTTKTVVCRIAERIAQQYVELAGADKPEVEEIEQFDFTLPDEREKLHSFGAEELVVFGVPVIAGRVPNVLLQYLHTIQGGGALAVPVVVYGNRNYDDALIELRDILEEDGFRTIAAAAFIGEHSFSEILAAGRPDEADLSIADSFASRIAAYVIEQDESEAAAGETIWKPVKVKGETPLRPYYQPRDREGKPVNILKVKPKTSEACTDCGICAAVCPMGSINAENVREFTGICIKCGACIKKCPTHAKYYDDEGYLYHKKELELGYERRAEPELFF